MANIQIFNNPILGNVRTVIINEKEYFYGVDIATALMYKRPRKAVIDHCKGVLSQDGSVLNQDDEPIIPEGDVYRLIIKAGQQGNSKEIKEKADKLEEWIFDDILPTLRKTGAYGQPKLPQNPMEILELHYEAIKHVDKKVDNVSLELKDMKDELENFKRDLPLLGIEEEKITHAVKSKGVAVMGGRQSNAYQDRSIVNSVYRDIYGHLYRNFGVKSYKAIKRSQCDKAVEIIERYEPPLILGERIMNCNAQLNITLS